ncbi:MarR family winged helix-turn-helix transcriptional regulator [Solicola sp. PLA-1-18]|uniref:MarR family winged helix-turn-helix transcriptional regulator n=1 Tax=Solicola sp. PLA-1-18 TaxID=3380532 RepID=UPI003B7C5AFF
MATRRTAADAPPTVGAALETAVSALVRWATRGEVDRSLHAGRAELSATDAWLLGRVVDVGPVRLTDLARWQAVDKSTMTTQVRRLEAKELVERQSDDADRRVTLIRATAKGRRQHRDNTREAQRVLDGLVEDWGGRDRAEFVRLLGMLVEQIESREAP